MSHTQTIRITNEGDIVVLRMQVRDLARAIGLNLADQARISLAASSVAKAIGLGITYPGQARLDDYCCGGHTGVRVVCTLVRKNSRPDDGAVSSGARSAPSAPGTLGEARWMVDELTFETLSLGEVQVTLVKWRT